MPIPRQLYRENILDDPIESLSFFVEQKIARIQTVTLVKVVKTYNNDGIEPVGLVDVQPLIQQLNYDGTATDHGIIHKIPYFRLQGGSNAVIIDPKVGDIGMCGFCSRDSSGVVANKDTTAPNCLRQYDLSDGLYIGGMLNGTPKQFIRFSSEGVEITASHVTINCDVTVNGKVTATGDVIGGDISLDNHTHTGVSTGPSNTGKPQ